MVPVTHHLMYWNCGIKWLANTTSLIQPMDQGVIESMKRRYRKELLKKLLLADAGTSYPEDTIIDFWKRINIKDAMFMVAAVWNDIPQSTIQASWRKLLKSSNSDGERSNDGQGSSASADQADSQCGQADFTTQENTASGSVDQLEHVDLPQVHDRCMVVVIVMKQI